MLFDTPKTPEEEKAIEDYRKKNPYGPITKLTDKEVEEAKKELERVKASRQSIKA